MTYPAYHEPPPRFIHCQAVKPLGYTGHRPCGAKAKMKYKGKNYCRACWLRVASKALDAAPAAAAARPVRAARRRG